MKVGLIGCGKQSGKHVGGLLAAGAEVVCADLDAGLAETLAADRGIEAAGSVDELFGRDDVWLRLTFVFQRQRTRH